jgi:hypothetical protein
MSYVKTGSMCVGRENRVCDKFRHEPDNNDNTVTEPTGTWMSWLGPPEGFVVMFCLRQKRNYMEDCQYVEFFGGHVSTKYWRLRMWRTLSHWVEYHTTIDIHRFHRRSRKPLWGRTGETEEPEFKWEWRSWVWGGCGCGTLLQSDTVQSYETRGLVSDFTRQYVKKNLTYEVAQHKNFNVRSHTMLLWDFTC